MSSGLDHVYLHSVGVVVPHKKNNYRPYALRHPVLYLLSVLIVLAKLSAVTIVALTPETAYLSTITSAYLIDQVNSSRRAAGLPSLAPNARLQESARMKAEDMLKYDYFAHNSPQGSTPWVWFDKANYNFVYAGENLAIDFTTGSAIHDAWMKSPGHRKNILNERYRDIGISVVTGEFEGRTTTVVVQHFGSLTSALPKKEPKVAPAEEPAFTAPVPNELKVAPTPVPAPTILEPTEGQILPDAAATVRGGAVEGSLVDVTFNDKRVGTYQTVKGEFKGNFSIPENTQQDATITAVAKINEKTSTPSEVHVKIDTLFPVIGQDSVMLLPEPKGDPGSLLLAVPVFGSTKKVVAFVDDRAIPLKIDGSIAIGSIESATATKEITIKAEDNLGHTKTAKVQPIQRYHVNPPTKTEVQARVKLSSINDILRTIFSLLVYILAFLLAINIFVHIKIQHSDLIVHVLFVITLGSVLFLIT